MDPKVKQALDITLQNWQTMTSYQSDEKEAVADQFQSSFYVFIDTVSDWVLRQEPMPQTLDEMLAIDMIQDIFDLLPAPLHLNLETELELMIDGVEREDEDKYD
ncbi:hypothetical protein PAECIP111891_03169 [Paenibacillus allorhizoplanae]|uniref:Uncharacterized protein n=1 Tax=Paenibacillus allorhizoplanae TaxID=2905648 RepID=A0ABM9CBE0_9BACL|nr:hypothetical protein [Paenibacillus allorhizoplanae]CAH1208170.1 hypothetical protein PAECIP111891_03169 [Paenibacillus allorhizoplanae]